MKTKRAMSFKIAAVAALAALSLIVCIFSSPPVLADHPAFLSFSAAWFDFNRHKDLGPVSVLEYRSAFEFWVV